MLKPTNAGFATSHAVRAAKFNNHFNPSSRRRQGWLESLDEPERCDSSRPGRLLKCRLDWYGWGSVEVGSLRLLTKDSLSVDLLHARVPFVAALRSIDNRAPSKRRP
jgi:hypothetical protein